MSRRGGKFDIKAHHNRLIAAGLCVRCRQPRDGASNWRCKACLRKMAEQQRSRSRGYREVRERPYEESYR